MEKILSNPGLQHLAENLFLNLSSADLKKCLLINQFTNQILENPMFWIKKLIQNGLSEENQNDWINAIQSETNFEKKKNIVDYLSWNSKKENCFDLPCYTKPVAQEDFWNKICRAAKCPEWKVGVMSKVFWSLKFSSGRGSRSSILDVCFFLIFFKSHSSSL